MRPCPGEPRALSWRSISPGSESPCMPMARPSSGKAMAPVKAMAHHRARCTTSPSRPQKPMPPNGRWRPSASHSVSSFIGAARPQHNRSPCPSHHHRPGCPPMPMSASTRTTRPRFRDPPAIMAAGRTLAEHFRERTTAGRTGELVTSNHRLAPRLSRRHPISSPVRSTRAFSPSPSPSGCGQGPSEICRLTALSRLRPAAVRSASPAVCATQSPRSQSQRRVHRSALPRPSPAAASGRQ